MATILVAYRIVLPLRGSKRGKPSATKSMVLSRLLRNPTGNDSAEFGIKSSSRGLSAVTKATRIDIFAIFLTAYCTSDDRPLGRPGICMIGSMLPPRMLPQKSLPLYAYLPGKTPHPVRHPAGHSYHVELIPVAVEASLSSEAFLWGLDLFNNGYYWEAHESWEGLWRVANRDDPLRILFKGLILLSAAGVKIRECKNAAAARHAKRAAALLRHLTKVPDRIFERALGMSPAALAKYAEAATRIPAELQATAPGQPQPVFNFILGSK